MRFVSYDLNLFAEKRGLPLTWVCGLFLLATLCDMPVAMESEYILCVFLGILLFVVVSCIWHFLVLTDTHCACVCVCVCVSVHTRIFEWLGERECSVFSSAATSVL